MNKNELAEIVKSAQNGSHKAFEILFKEFNQQIYYSILLIVKNDGLAEDITQETFITVIRKINELENPEAFPSWIKKIAHSKCSDFYKKKEVIHETTISTDEDDDYDVFGNIEESDREFIPDAALDRDDLKKIIFEILNQLPDVQRSAILMRYYEDLSVKEIADIQEVSEGTVMSRLNYGRKAIAKAIEDYEKENDIKLHSIPFIPFFHWILEATQNNIASRVVGNIASGVSEATGVTISATTLSGSTTAAGTTVLSGTAAVGGTVTTAATATGGLAAKIAAIPLAAKIAAPVVAVAVAITPVAVKNAQKADTISTTQTSITEQTDAQIILTDSVTAASASDVTESEATTEKATLIVETPDGETVAVTVNEATTTNPSTTGKVQASQKPTVTTTKKPTVVTTNQTIATTQNKPITIIKPIPTTIPKVDEPVVVVTIPYTTTPYTTAPHITVTQPTVVSPTQPTTVATTVKPTTTTTTKPVVEDEVYDEYEEEIYDDVYDENYDEDIFDIHDNPEDYVEPEEEVVETEGGASVEIDGTLAY